MASSRRRGPSSSSGPSGRMGGRRAAPGSRGQSRAATADTDRRAGDHDRRAGYVLAPRPRRVPDGAGSTHPVRGRRSLRASPAGMVGTRHRLCIVILRRGCERARGVRPPARDRSSHGDAAQGPHRTRTRSARTARPRSQQSRDVILSGLVNAVGIDPAGPLPRDLPKTLEFDRVRLEHFLSGNWVGFTLLVAVALLLDRDHHSHRAELHHHRCRPQPRALGRRPPPSSVRGTTEVEGPWALLTYGRTPSRALVGVVLVVDDDAILGDVLDERRHCW